ncbi:MAG TPA: amylo-alpha-1,6-glucosidase [Candidatus Paceibacterota bacterium]|nr:amylo-alpha-1,6-glucosidase [Candidatus Paceibacterota bacterium]
MRKDINDLREPERGYIRAGFPKFSWCFARDTLTIVWQIMELTDEYGEMIGRSLDFIAKLQGTKTDPLSGEEPGKIFHEWGPDPETYHLPWQVPYYGSVDSTPLFAFVCGLYFEKTGDETWLKKMWPHIERALDWCERYGNRGRGIFLAYEREGVVGLGQQGWKDSDEMNIAAPVQIVEAQGYYYKALMSAAGLAEKLGKQGNADAFRSRAEALKKTFIGHFWSEEDTFFLLARNGRDEADRRITSNPGHLLFTGILNGEKEKTDAIVQRLFAPDMWTPYGIRTHSTLNPDFGHLTYHRGSVWPHDNWIIAQGFLRLGYAREYEMVKAALFGAYRLLGKIPELYGVTNSGELREIPEACVPQGWASGALLNFLLSE